MLYIKYIYVLWWVVWGMLKCELCEVIVMLLVPVATTNEHCVCLINKVCIVEKYTCTYSEQWSAFRNGVYK